MDYSKVLILDFGSQVTKLIARKIRELNIYSEILPYETNLKKIEDINNTDHLSGVLEELIDDRSINGTIEN